MLSVLRWIAKHVAVVPGDASGAKQLEIIMSRLGLRKEDDKT